MAFEQQLKVSDLWCYNSILHVIIAQISKHLKPTVLAERLSAWSVGAGGSASPWDIIPQSLTASDNKDNWHRAHTCEDCKEAINSVYCIYRLWRSNEVKTEFLKILLYFQCKRNLKLWSYFWKLKYLEYPAENDVTRVVTKSESYVVVKSKDRQSLHSVTMS